MKKSIITICLLLTLTLLSSCGTQNAIDGTVDTSKIENQDHLHEHYGNEADDENVEDGDVDVEIEQVPLYADSIDELIGTIRNVKQGKESDINNISALNTLIVPDFTIDGYYLMKIEVTEVSVFYYYTPLTVSRSDGLVDYDRDYIVTVRRREFVNQDDPLQPLIDQLKLTPDDNGYLYDSANREITFAYDDVWVSIRVPATVTDYDKIASLCTVKSVKLD